ncbi:MAG: mannose-6-phosphate isomerase, class I [Caldibacillus sp.]
MTEPLFLQPVFQERIWGGTRLKEQFQYDIPSDRTGECWAISGHPNGQSVVKNGPHAGKTIGELWENHRELFGNLEGDVFPLLVKILDANADLSVQVHPDDEYAAKYENGELGKTECWYIIDCKEDAEIVFGHTAKTKEELRQQIEAGNWDELLRRVPIKPGDFFFVPSGTIHALCEGTLVLETQQSSDTTYRVYDYDRIDQNGNKRELHIEKSIDVTTVPHRDPELNITTKQLQDAQVTTFIQGEYFSVYKWDVNGKLVTENKQPFLLFSVLAGNGNLQINDQTYSLNKGDHFILPATVKEFSLDGNLQLIVSHV